MENPMNEPVAKSSVFYRGGDASVGSLVSGRGARVTDSTGREYIDAMGGVAVQIIGHGNETVAAAMSDAAQNYVYAYAQNFTTPMQEEFAERLVNRLSLPKGSKLYFASGGSESNEMALKFARQYHLERGNPGKYKVIRREHAYHGNTFGTLSVSDRPSWRSGFEPYLFESPVAPGWLTARSLMRAEGNEAAITAHAIETLERLIWSSGAETISVMILEPMSGSSIAGASMPAGYIERVRELCDQHDILLISDEVFVGYGRIGYPSALAGLGAQADITVLGKGLGSGYAPLSAAVLSPKVMAGLGGSSAQHGQGYTFSGLPFSCAVGCAVSDVIEEQGLFAESARLGEIMHVRLRERLQGSPFVGDIRGRGMLAGIELVQDKHTLTPFSEGLGVAGQIAAALRDRGIIASPGSPHVDDARGGDQLHLAPPYVITEQEIDTVIEALAQSIDEVCRAI